MPRQVWLFVFLWFFFFQAEDGIRDTSVTGVQTCALPICFRRAGQRRGRIVAAAAARYRPGDRRHVVGDRGDRRRPGRGRVDRLGIGGRGGADRSEERRVGEERRSRWWSVHERKKRRNREE